MQNTSDQAGFLSPVSASPEYDIDLDKVLQETVVGITGLAPTKVRPRWQPKPPKQLAVTENWCGIGVMEIDADYDQALVHDGSADMGTGVSISQRHESVQAMATFYGPNCVKFATLLRDGLFITQNRDQLFLKGLVLDGIDRLQLTAEMLHEQWVRRCDLTFTLRRQVDRTWNIRNIVQAQGTIVTEKAGDDGTLIPSDEAWSTANVNEG